MAPWTFVHVADMQPGSPRSFRFAPAWRDNWRTARQQIIEMAPELILVGGDVTRDGSFHLGELTEMRDDLAALPMPSHVIPGNMDTGNKHAAVQGPRDNRDDRDLNVTSAQLAQFASVFGPMPWSLVHKQVRFSGCYAVVAGTGLPEEQQMWRWLAELADAPRADHHVMITHYPLFFDRFDEPNFDIREPSEYLAWYFCIDHPHRDRLLAAFKAAGVTIAISGHIHCGKSDVVDGIRFIKAPATAMAQMTQRWPDGEAALGFLRFDVTETGIESQLVPLARCSDAAGYGPGGHPLPEVRDYSLAWEKPAFDETCEPGGE